MNLGSTTRVFIDTEFTDFLNTDLISIGLATSDGHEFYCELSDFNRASASGWVRSNIYPLLDFSKHGMKRGEASARLWQWFDDLPAQFVIISDDYGIDRELLIDLLGEVHPKMLAFENIFANMVILEHNNPDLTNVRSMFHHHFLEYFFKTKETQHHALSDAKANRYAYNNLVAEFGLAP